MPSKDFSAIESIRKISWLYQNFQYIKGVDRKLTLSRIKFLFIKLNSYHICKISAIKLNTILYIIIYIV